MFSLTLCIGAAADYVCVDLQQLVWPLTKLARQINGLALRLRGTSPYQCEQYHRFVGRADLAKAVWPLHCERFYLFLSRGLIDLSHAKC